MDTYTGSEQAFARVGMSVNDRQIRSWAQGSVVVGPGHVSAWVAMRREQSAKDADPVVCSLGEPLARISHHVEGWAVFCGCARA